MSDAEKIAERLESVTLFQSYKYNLTLNNEAAALIRRLQAENEALRVKQAGLVALVQKAYHEGFREGAIEHTTPWGGKGWHKSRTRAALEEVNRE